MDHSYIVTFYLKTFVFNLKEWPWIPLKDIWKNILDESDAMYFAFHGLLHYPVGSEKRLEIQHYSPELCGHNAQNRTN